MSNPIGSIELRLFRVSGSDEKGIFVGTIRFEDLLQIHKFSARVERREDIDFDSGNFERDATNQGIFQRRLSENKVSKLKKYLKKYFEEKGELPTFPTSVIICNNSPEYYGIDFSGLEQREKLNIARNYDFKSRDDFVFPITDEDANSTIAFIPRNKEITLIVDGQHRFAGILGLYNEYSNSLFESVQNQCQSILDYRFIITYLIGYDIYEVGQVFADVNFNQKPVNRSLYYDIFGSAPYTDDNGGLFNDIRLAHNLAVHMNNNQKSPLNGMIKLLGKGEGLVSQAFFVDKIIDNLFKDSWKPLVDDYNDGGSKYKIMAPFLRAYFSAIKRAYPSSWPNHKPGTNSYSSFHYSNILCKTTGMGAFLRLINTIYPRIDLGEETSMENQIYKMLSGISDGEVKTDFSKDGKFGGASGEGKQKELFDFLKRKLSI